MIIRKSVQIESDFSEVSKVYPGLVLHNDADGVAVVRGLLDFSAQYENIPIDDSFSLEIILPESYSKSIPPIVKEVGGRIPNEFHKYPDGSLCLGAPLEVRKTFSENPTILGFLTFLVIPYLFSFCYWEKNQRMPFGERSHGVSGIIESYRDLFNVTSDIISLHLLKILAEGSYRGHSHCPCGIGVRLRNCHGPQLLKLRSYQNQHEFLCDYIRCLDNIHKSNQKLPQSLITKKLMAVWKRHQKELNNNEKRATSTFKSDIAIQEAVTLESKRI